MFQSDHMRTGFDGFFTKKAGKSGEGEALFFRTSRYRLATRRDVNLRDLFARICVGEGDVTRYAELQSMLRSSPSFVQTLSRVGPPSLSLCFFISNHQKSSRYHLNINGNLNCVRGEWKSSFFRLDNQILNAID